MSTVLAIAGFAIAVIVFLNLLQGAESVQRSRTPSVERDAKSEDPRARARSFLRRAPERRICPVCRTGLTQEEYLICGMDPERDGQKRQVHIYGCAHCFATDGVNREKYELMKDF